MLSRLLATLVAGSMVCVLAGAGLVWSASAGASPGRRVADSSTSATAQGGPTQTPGSGLPTGDPRHVRRPSVPPPCRFVFAGVSTSTGTFSARDESNPPDTQRIQAALDACAGTGRAVELVPRWDQDAFLSGPLTVHEGEVLVVDGGTTLYASLNPSAYQIPGSTTCGTISGAGNGCVPFIDLAGSHSGVMGTRGPRGEMGVIDGRGQMTMLGSTLSWWALAEEAKSGGNQNNPKLIESDGADDLTVSDVELANSPMHHVLIQDGRGLTVWGIVVDTRAAGARNTDGVDPLSESDVTIAHNFLQDGDDCIAIKSNPGLPSDNITVEDNHCYGTHGISIGSQTGGGVANILVHDDTLSGTDSLGNVSTSNNGIRIKSDALAGGVTQQVTYYNICMTGVQNPLCFNPFYAAGGTTIPTFTDIVLNGIVAVDSPADTASLFQGYDANHLLGLDLENVQLDNATQTAANARIGLYNSNVVPSGPNVIVTPIHAPGRIPACR
ncbi:MAG: glycoside hydrolase family 28 protein, partial [Solirubrobacteraceae bacterium]